MPQDILASHLALIMKVLHDYVKVKIDNLLFNQVDCDLAKGSFMHCFWASRSLRLSQSGFAFWAFWLSSFNCWSFIPLRMTLATQLQYWLKSLASSGLLLIFWWLRSWSLMQFLIKSSLFCIAYAKLLLIKNTIPSRAFENFVDKIIEDSFLRKANR